MTMKSELADNSDYFLFITSCRREPFWPIKPVNSLRNVNQLNISTSCYLWDMCALNNAGNTHDYPRDLLSSVSLLLTKWTIE